MPVRIPTEYRELLDGPYVVTLATVLPDGQPHLSAMWCLLDGDDVLFSTIKQRQKYLDLSRCRQATVLAFRPDNPYRYIEVRGEVVEITEQGGIELIDRLAKLYSGVDRYYGGVRSREALNYETRVVIRLRPHKVVTRG